MNTSDPWTFGKPLRLSSCCCVCCFVLFFLNRIFTNYLAKSCGIFIYLAHEAVYAWNQGVFCKIEQVVHHLHRLCLSWLVLCGEDTCCFFLHASFSSTRLMKVSLLLVHMRIAQASGEVAQEVTKRSVISFRDWDGVCFVHMMRDSCWMVLAWSQDYVLGKQRWNSQI